MDENKDRDKNKDRDRKQRHKQKMDKNKPRQPRQNLQIKLLFPPGDHMPYRDK